jgi:hypothetical protein
LFKVTLALGSRAPVESETEPENEAVEASVWPCATGRATVNKRLATARDRSTENLRNVGIDAALLESLTSQLAIPVSNSAHSSIRALVFVKKFFGGIFAGARLNN